LAVGWTAHVWLTIAATAAFGHGNPVNVDVNDNALIVSGGLAMAQGFASQSWDSHEDAALDTASGNRLTSTYPGYNVMGMESSAPLQLEVISRPDYTASGSPDRWLWYWSATAKVTSVPGNARFDAVPLFVLGAGAIQIQQATLVMGPATTMANQIGPFMNSHAHLLSYELRNSPVAQPGVYAFFARLISPGLGPSEPFLLAFRNQISVDVFEEAVTDINKAAAPSGDYNSDNIVDAADYVVWRKTAGGDEEYAAWRENFATTIDSAGGSMGFEENVAVPEPATSLAPICAVALIASCRGRRRINVNADYGRGRASLLLAVGLQTQRVRQRPRMVLTRLKWASAQSYRQPKRSWLAPTSRLGQCHVHIRIARLHPTLFS
jgi:hypothetical protein